MKDDRVFEVLEVQQQDNQWIIDGLTFDTLTKGMLLSTSEQMDNILSVEDIVIFGRHIDEVDRGYYIWLTVRSINDVDFAHVKYLWKV